jgi:transposase
MRPPVWQPPIALSHAEQAIVSRIRRAKLFIFLRHRRHELFSTAFQEELATIFPDRPKGQPPVPPAQLALVTLLQAYTGASDEEAIEALLMDRRWQLVLDCLDCAAPPLSTSTLVRFRAALITHGLDRRLVERTIELATQHRGFSPRALRAALDSSPLWGTARVEDTSNLLGHALRKALRVVARQQGRGLAAVATEAGAEVVSTSSLKAAGVTPANTPEASVMEPIVADLTAQAVTLQELHIDRAYLSSPLVRERPAGLEIFCKAWPVRNGARFPKTAFVLDWEAGTIRCPNAVTMPFEVGGVVHFPATTCAVCPLQAQCTSSVHGRSISIHPDERLLGELRARQQTSEGRAKLRERIAVEHTLAHVGRWQGGRARYRGQRKNLFDLRRSAVIHNLHVLARMPEAA